MATKGHKNEDSAESQLPGFRASFLVFWLSAILGDVRPFRVNLGGVMASCCLRIRLCRVYAQQIECNCVPFLPVRETRHERRERFKALDRHSPFAWVCRGSLARRQYPETLLHYRSSRTRYWRLPAGERTSDLLKSGCRFQSQRVRLSGVHGDSGRGFRGTRSCLQIIVRFLASHGQAKLPVGLWLICHVILSELNSAHVSISRQSSPT